MNLIKKIILKIDQQFKRSKIFYLKNFAPIKWKEYNELIYWKNRKRQEGDLTNNHYQYFYTEHFGLNFNFYDNKTILDIGCGPRGSLEWASNTTRRMGLDPLAKEYLDIGAAYQKMEYLDSPSEKIPLEDGICDAVFSFNSLDHVENVRKTIQEIKRVVKRGGIFLLLVEVNHAPTACEPHQLNQKDLISLLKPEFSCEDLKVFKPSLPGMYQSILEGKLISKPIETTEVGYLSAKFCRNS